MWQQPLGPATHTLRCETAQAALLFDAAGRERRQFDSALAALEWMEADARAAAAPCRWTGYLSYDLGRLFERLPSRHRSEPELPLFVFTRHLLAPQSWEQTTAPFLAALPSIAPSAHALHSNFSRSAYLAAVQRAIDYIGAGDIFQVNLAQRFTVSSDESAASLYSRIQSHFPAWYAGVLDYGDHALVCNSPELFLAVTPQPAGQRRIVTRPIKGTRPRQPGMAEELRDSRKDEAELNMIVDLERNDLGRICKIGSVHVSEHRSIESHPTVYHGAATITGSLREEVTFVDILPATFPGGSITGAPKIRAMEIIEELEPTRRGPYCGAIGYLDSSGAMQFNIAIRTLIMVAGRVHIPVGGGIVADSTPEAEYEETLVKAKAALAVLGVDGQIVQLD